MSKRERIGVAVLCALVALSLVVVWLFRSKPAVPDTTRPPYYKNIEIMEEAVDSVRVHDAKPVKKRAKPAKGSGKPGRPVKKKAAPRSPLDEPC